MESSGFGFALFIPVCILLDPEIVSSLALLFLIKMQPTMYTVLTEGKKTLVLTIKEHLEVYIPRTKRSTETISKNIIIKM